MRVVIQRVLNASVTVQNIVKGRIENGLLLFVGFSHNDTIEDLQWLCNKIIHMRIFSDDEGKMNLSLIDKNAELLVVSQFTLYALTQKGNRPSFINAAKPEQAKMLYEYCINYFEQCLNKKIEQGEFGADMKINLLNDGPVTIIMDSNDKSNF
jgi:D-aminoacyl-tRNA deacylase